jgi:hypothetical protein
VKRVAALAAIAFMAGGTALAESRDWAPELQATAKKCGIPPKQLQFVDGSVRWIAPETTTYNQAKCVFDELKARGVPTKQGYVSSVR